MIEHQCPKCGGPMLAPERLSGQPQTCPSCGNVTRVPALPQSRDEQVVHAQGPSGLRSETPKVEVPDSRNPKAKGVKRGRNGALVLMCVVAGVYFANLYGVFDTDPEKAKEKMYGVAREIGGDNPRVVRLMVHMRENGYGWGEIDSAAEYCHPDVRDAYMAWREAERKKNPGPKVPASAPAKTP